MLQALFAYLRSVATPRPPHPPQSFPSSTKSPAENFKTMRLRYRTYSVDELGRWWKVEARHCPFTGVILRKTERISD